MDTFSYIKIMDELVAIYFNIQLKSVSRLENFHCILIIKIAIFTHNNLRS